MTDWFIAAAIFSMAAVLFLESLFPLHKGKAPLRRWLHNLILSAIALATSLATPLLLWSMVYALGGQAPNGVGLMDRLGLPVWLQWGVTFLVMDGVAYALHRLSHRVPFLWRLHAVHHTDLELDATTTHRHHPLENLLTVAVNLPVLLYLGPPVWPVLAYSLVSLGVSTFSHGNLKLPVSVDRWLSRVLVTPAFHRLHHSAEQFQTDSNYATVFSFWDHAFKSAGQVPDDGGAQLTLGLENWREARHQTVLAMLLAPFRKP